MRLIRNIPEVRLKKIHHVDVWQPSTSVLEGTPWKINAPVRRPQKETHLNQARCFCILHVRLRKGKRFDGEFNLQNDSWFSLSTETLKEAGCCLTCDLSCVGRWWPPPFYCCCSFPRLQDLTRTHIERVFSQIPASPLCDAAICRNWDSKVLSKRAGCSTCNGFEAGEVGR